MSIQRDSPRVTGTEHFQTCGKNSIYCFSKPVMSARRLNLLLMSRVWIRVCQRTHERTCMTKCVCVCACMCWPFVCLTVLAGQEIIHILSEPRMAPVFQKAPPHVRDRILLCKEQWPRVEAEYNTACWALPFRALSLRMKKGQ